MRIPVNNEKVRSLRVRLRLAANELRDAAPGLTPGAAITPGDRSGAG